ncbi:TraB/GumN family protein [Enterococcus timonensis]|uniref:TraB/GumN family protein n=1 Tax=Enterococcus timonensis TaxID=1852364 RepID=UPI0008DB29BE|nr:TraB/GumN family protein [Enterococcus timonensis]
MEELIERVNYQGKEIIIVGTNHAQASSAEVVKEVIAKELPETVCVELDEKRYAARSNQKNWEETDIIQIIRQKQTILFFVQLLYGALQKKMAQKMGSQKAGGDMEAALASAKEIGASIELVDRDIQVTFKKMWRSLSFWQKIRLPFMAFDSIDEEKLTGTTLEDFYESDLVDSTFLSLKEQLPGPYEELIENRDSYLSMKIKNAPGKKIVAVVGRAHVPGIIEKLPENIDLVAMDIIPKKKWTSKVINWIIPALLVGLVAWSFVASAETGWRQLSIWLLWNSGLAALFTAFTLPHPLTILVAFVTAPIGTLSPVLAVGFFTAISEAFLRKPRVKDFNHLQEDVLHVKSFYKNRALKILLIFFVSSLGGALGNFIGGLQMIRNLF